MANGSAGIWVRGLICLDSPWRSSGPKVGLMRTARTLPSSVRKKRLYSNLCLIASDQRVFQNEMCYRAPVARGKDVLKDTVQDPSCILDRVAQQMVDITTPNPPRMSWPCLNRRSGRIALLPVYHLEHFLGSARRIDLKDNRATSRAYSLSSLR